MDRRATQQCNMCPYICLCSLLAATSQFRVYIDSIGQKIQLTGWENANNMRNATCADTQRHKRQFRGPTVHSYTMLGSLSGLMKLCNKFTWCFHKAIKLAWLITIFAMQTYKEFILQLLWTDLYPGRGSERHKTLHKDLYSLHDLYYFAWNW